MGFGHNDMFWYRLVERLGRNSVVGTTARGLAELPQHLVADEHHVKWCGEKGYVATTAAGGCLLGVALSKSASEESLTVAYVRGRPLHNGNRDTRNEGGRLRVECVQ